MGLPLVELRRALLQKAEEYNKKDKTFKKEELIDIIRAENPNMIKNAEIELTRIAMFRILNGNLFSPKTLSIQGNLFGGGQDFISLGGRSPEISPTNKMDLSTLIEMTKTKKINKKNNTKEKLNHYYRCILDCVDKTPINFEDAKKEIFNSSIKMEKLGNLLNNIE